MDRFLALVAALVAGGCPSAPRSHDSAAPAPRADWLQRFSPRAESRWWQESPPCPEGALLAHSAADIGHPDQCDQPICEVFCARSDGTRHGPTSGWYVGTGMKHHEGLFWDGAKAGRWLVWYVGGGKSDDGSYRAGDKDGVWKQWWEGGEPYRVAEFVAGKVVTITSFRDGKPLPTEHVEIEGQGLAPPAATAGEERTGEAESRLVAVEESAHAPGQGRALAAVRGAFPEAYEELATVTYVRFGPGFAIEAVMVLVPEVAIKTLSTAELAARACAIKKSLGLDCACEEIDLAPAKDYAWHSWPDKRVVPVTVRFAIGC